MYTGMDPAPYNGWCEMAFTIYSFPDASTFTTIAAGQTISIIVPPTLVAAYQDFEFEFLFPSVSASHAGTFAAIYRALTTAATGATNQDALGSAVQIVSQTGSIAFIRDVYGMITRQVTVRVTAADAIQFRLTVLGIS